MKVKVIEKFKDKHTGKIHKVGAILDITEKRFAEILTVGKFVEKVEEPAEEKEEPKKKTAKKKEK